MSRLDLLRSWSEKQEIRKLLGTDKIIIGTDRTLKALKKGELAKVVVSSNCSQKTLDALSLHAKKTEIVNISEDNDELAVICKKPFRIALLGIKNG